MRPFLIPKDIITHLLLGISTASMYIQTGKEYAGKVISATGKYERSMKI